MVSDPELRVLMVCGFPPPVGGAAKVNEAVFDDIQRAGVRVTKMTVSVSKIIHAPGLSVSTIAYHIARVTRNFIVALQLLFGPTKGATVYLVPSAGGGLIYSYIHFLISKLRHAKLVIQHHSYYGTNYRPLLARIAKKSDVSVLHSFSSRGMAERFKRMYGDVQSIVVTNARFVQPNPEVAREETSLVVADAASPRLGHLSNLCKEKGFFLVARLFEELNKTGFSGELIIAGPILESEVKSTLESLQEKYPGRVKYLGPLYGQAKLDFYRHIDLFLFPSQYSQEAHPLVVYEALAAGTPVLGTPRGGIAELLGGELGDTSTTDDQFVPFAVDRIRSLDFGTAAILRRRQIIFGRFLAVLDESVGEYAELYRKIGFRFSH